MIVSLVMGGSTGLQPCLAPWPEAHKLKRLAGLCQVPSLNLRQQWPGSYLSSAIIIRRSPSLPLSMFIGKGRGLPHAWPWGIRSAAGPVRVCRCALRRPVYVAETGTALACREAYLFHAALGGDEVPVIAMWP